MKNLFFLSWSASFLCLTESLVFFLLIYIYVIPILSVATAMRKRRKSTFTCHSIFLSLSLVLLIFRFVNTNLAFSPSHSVLFYDCVKKNVLYYFSSVSLLLSSRLSTGQNKLLIIKQHAGSSNSNKNNET
jgi:hypothetical protein